MAEAFKLSSGLEVLLEENHESPVISFHLLVKVGSAMEKRNEAGISHLIEHMLFKGTPSHGVGEIARDVEAAGGEINAYTSFDQTVYYINMASRFSDKGLAILTDAIQHPLFDKTELDREKEVVLEEIRREKDNPGHRSSELLFINSFKSHPYKNPIIGRAETVKGFTKADILSYYRRWYTPDNISFIVVGDFDTASMLKKIRKAFAGFKGRKVSQVELPKEPLSKDLSIYSEANPVNSTYFSIGFKIPHITHEDIPALDVLSHVLAGTDSSILEQEIQEKRQLVNDIQSYAFTPRHPGLLIIGALTAPEKISKAVKAVWDEIYKLHSMPIKTSELERAKLNIRSNEIYEKETTGGMAGKYAYYLATAGTHLFEKKYFQSLQNVTNDDIKRIAQKYLTPKNLTLVIVHPENKQKIDTSSLAKHIKHTGRSAKILVKTRSGEAPIVHRLSNGIQLVMREEHRLPIVSVCSAFLGGIRFENKKNNGINNLIALTITKGTKNKSAIEIAKKIEQVAGNIGAFSGRNSFGIKSDFLSDKFDEGFGLFSEVLTQPDFAPIEIKREKLQVLDAIKNQEDALTSLAFKKFLTALFPHHPYGLRSLGEKDSVRALKRSDLFHYYQRIASPREMIISVVGDISPDEVIRRAEERLIFPWHATSCFQTPKAETANKKPIEIEYKRPGKEQAHIVMGFLGPRLITKDRYAISVLNNILSGQGGRLFLNLRDKMSLAYAVNSTFFAGLEPGFIAIYIGTEPGKVDRAISGIKYELERLVDKGVTLNELNRSKNFIVGSFELERQRNSNLADSYAFNLLYGLGIKEVEDFPKKISSITQKDILDVARKYLRLEAPVTAIIRPT